MSNCFGAGKAGKASFTEMPKDLRVLYVSSTDFYSRSHPRFTITNHKTKGAQFSVTGLSEVMILTGTHSGLCPSIRGRHRGALNRVWQFYAACKA